jgi:hypothetical protein
MLNEHVLRLKYSYPEGANDRILVTSDREYLARDELETFARLTQTVWPECFARLAPVLV